MATGPFRCSVERRRVGCIARAPELSPSRTLPFEFLAGSRQTTPLERCGDAHINVAEGRVVVERTPPVATTSPSFSMSHSASASSFCESTVAVLGVDRRKMPPGDADLFGRRREQHAYWMDVA